MKLYLGLSYSNLQGKYRVPCFISGVLLNDKNLENVACNIEKKTTPIKLTSSSNELYQRRQNIQQYLNNCVTISIEKPIDCVSSISEMYAEAINYLMGGKYPLIKEDLVISYHEPIRIPGYTREDISSDLRERLDRVSHSVRVRPRAPYDYPSEIASFLAKSEYTLIKNTKLEVLQQKISRSSTRCIQFYKMSYQRQYPEDYLDTLVSLPELVLKRAKSYPFRKILRVNKTTLCFEPLARFCKGTRENGLIKPCFGSSEKNPFGNLVFGTERCNVCKKVSKHVDCLIDKPDCDGYSVKCGHSDFAAEICNGDFGVYITRYCDSLKVGKALLCNIISRLLDQGANSALLLYPIPNIKTCYLVEHQLKDFLEKNVSVLGDFIKDATLCSPKTKTKIRDFLNNWDRDDTFLLENVLNLLLEKCDIFELNKTSKIDKKICNFLPNYKKPPFNEVREIIYPPNNIRGKIVGYRGNIAFLDGQKAVNIKLFQGYVMKGGIRYD